MSKCRTCRKRDRTCHPPPDIHSDAFACIAYQPKPKPRRSAEALKAATFRRAWSNHLWEIEWGRTYPPIACDVGVSLAYFEDGRIAIRAYLFVAFWQVRFDVFRSERGGKR